jgi:Holliday junction DNA helicase RuvA
VCRAGQRVEEQAEQFLKFGGGQCILRKKHLCAVDHQQVLCAAGGDGDDVIGIFSLYGYCGFAVCQGGKLQPDAIGVLAGDEKALTAAPGIGKKLAQRILLELKDKMSGDQLEAASAATGINVPDLAAPGGALEDAMAALAVLGYPRAVAAAALQGVDTAGMATDEIVRAALKRLF